MIETQLEQEIALLEKRLAKAKASKPAHDTTGAYVTVLLEIEDELAEKRQALDHFGSPAITKPNQSGGPKARNNKNEE